MPHHTTAPLPKDRNGDIRYPDEATWPIRARCIRCAGRCQLTPIIDGRQSTEHVECPHCNGRGYYFLPLGD